MRIRQLGLSLVEVMVAVVIGLIGILIITQAYITSDNFNRSTLGEGGAQMNGLVALYSLERDLRMAGWGINNSQARVCNDMYWYYDGNHSVNNAGPLPNVKVAPVLISYDTVTPANPDQIVVFYSTEQWNVLPVNIAAYNAAVPDVQVDGADGFATGQMILLVSTNGCTLRKISNANYPSSRLEFAAGPSNLHNPAGWGTAPVAYKKDDVVINLGTATLRTYLVSAGKLVAADSLLQGGFAVNQVIVDSIVDMRALYGRDTDSDNVVDIYDKQTPVNPTMWQQTQAIKIGILARIGNYEKPSVSGGNCDATTVMPTWQGSTATGLVWTSNPFQAINIATPTSQDRCYRYRVFETTIPLRNMIWAAS